MTRDPLRVLNLEADAEDHELIRKQVGSSGLTVKFERAGRPAIAG